MLNQGLKTYKLLNLTSLLTKQMTKTHGLTTTCLCGQVYVKPNQRQDSSYFKRVHSTQSDQHRQKVVMETSSPVIDKMNYEKVLPLEKDADFGKLFKEKISPYIQLARWDKPIGIYLLYWPCAWSISIATITSGAPVSTALSTAGLFLVGAGLMRGAGCTLNDMWDRDIDKQVERTGSRPLVVGSISDVQATAFLAAQLTGALAVLLQLNCYSIVLGASSMFLVVTYPLAKRITNYPQVYLGATFNWGALLGYTAVTGACHAPVCLPLYAGALAWTVIYDTIYAHQDKLDDARIGMKSTALTFGDNTKPALTAALLFSTAAFSAAGYAADLSPIYALAMAGYAGHVGRQIYTLDMDNPTDCANKFKSNSLVGLIMLLGIIGGGWDTYQRNKAKGNTGESAKGCLFS